MNRLLNRSLLGLALLGHGVASPAPALAQPGPAATPRPGLGTQAIELAPTEALFDAVNRGDLAAARDAVSRGAELNTRNTLGETPTELAVSLGRTEIAFFLLSLRRPSRAELPPVVTAPAPPAAPARNAARPAPPVPAGQPPRARLWAGDGGAPVPEWGFLGFDAGRPGPPPGPTPGPSSGPRRRS